MSHPLINPPSPLRSQPFISSARTIPSCGEAPVFLPLLAQPFPLPRPVCPFRNDTFHLSCALLPEHCCGSFRASLFLWRLSSGLCNALHATHLCFLCKTKVLPFRVAGEEKWVVIKSTLQTDPFLPVWQSRGHYSLLGIICVPEVKTTSLRLQGNGGG